jgi:ABC-type Fe3+ transport system permease subunit
VLGLIAGAPLGMAAGLYDFRGRRALVALAALPLLLPSFLWAIGWSTLACDSRNRVSRGVNGCVLVGATTTASLIFVTSWAAVRDLSRSQVEAARLAGGEPALLRCTGRHVGVPALLTAALGSVLTLADPGPGQIFGVRTVASEILTSFAARYDVGLAARQSVALTVVVLSAAIPLAVIAGPRLAHAVLGRQSTRSTSARRSGTAGIAAAFAVLLLLAVGLPVAGLLAALVAGPWTFVGTVADVATENWQRNHLVLAMLGALDTTAATATDTLVYAAGAGLVATTLGLGIAIAAGRNPSLRSVVVAISVALLAWPPAASALGVVSAATAAPVWLDGIVRSRLPVCVLLGLRFFPVSAVLALGGRHRAVLGARRRGTASRSGPTCAVSHGRRFVRARMLDGARGPARVRGSGRRCCSTHRVGSHCRWQSSPSWRMPRRPPSPHCVSSTCSRRSWCCSDARYASREP